jgi:hypothetical protein
MDAPPLRTQHEVRRWELPDETWQRNLKNRIQSSLGPLVRDALRKHAEQLHGMSADDIVSRAATNAQHEAVMDDIRRRAQVEFDTHLNGEILQRRFVAEEDLSPDEWETLQKYQQTLYDHVAKGSPDRARSLSNTEPLPIERRSSASASAEQTNFMIPVRPTDYRSGEGRPRGSSVASTSSLENHLWARTSTRNRTNSAGSGVGEFRTLESAIDGGEHWTPLTPPDDPISHITHAAPSAMDADVSLVRRKTSRSMSRGRGWRAGISPGPYSQSSRTLANALTDAIVPPSGSSPPPEGRQSTSFFHSVLMVFL